MKLSILSKKNQSNKFINISFIFVLFVCFSFANYVNAEDVAFNYVKQIGSSTNDVALSVAVDSSGSVYSTGYFTGTVDFDPGAGTSNLTSAGTEDIFISKLDSSGAFVWAKQFSGTGSDLGYSIVVGSDGNIYVTGSFNDTVDFDTGVGTSNLTSAGGSEIFVSKLNSSGDLVWAKQFAGSGTDASRSVVVDSSGNVYTTGSFTGTADFDPGAGTSNLSSAGSSDIFISKLDSSGAFVWAKNIGSTGSDKGFAIKLDSSNNVYTTGDFRLTVDFDPGAGTSNIVSTTDGVYVSKLDSSGNFVWAKSMGAGTGTSFGTSLAIDSSSNVYTFGYFTSTIDFDPGDATANLTSAGSEDIFISKLDSSGTFVYIKQVGGTGSDDGLSIVNDSSGNIYITGDFRNTVDFDPGAGTTNLVSVASDDIYVSKYDSSGNFVWAKGVGGSGIDVGNSIAQYNGSVYIAGYFNSTVDFDPGASTVNLTSAGGSDIFILKLTDSTAPIISVVTVVTTPTSDTTPNYIFTTDEAGTISYGGSCSSATTSATSGSNTITFTTLTDGTYSNCTITVTDASGNASNTLSVASFVVDSTSAVISSITATATTNSVVITWTTNESASSIVSYGPDTTYDNSSSSGTLVTSHSVTLSNLIACSTYYYKVESNDVVSNNTLGTASSFVTSGCSGGVTFTSQSLERITVASGGTLTEGSLSLTVPPSFTGSGSQAVFQTSQLEATFFDSVSLPTGKNKIGNEAFNLKALIDAETSISSFSTALTISFSYTAGDVVGIDETSLVIYRYDGSIWYALSDCSVNTTTKVVTCSTSNFSDFALFGDTTPEVTNNTSGAVPLFFLLLNQQPIPKSTESFKDSCLPGEIFDRNTGKRCNSELVNKFKFNKNLQYKDNNTDVKELQKFLNSHGFMVSEIGPGSKGQETNYFGMLTKKALIQFQKYKNIKPSIGYLGPLTRGIANE